MRQLAAVKVGSDPQRARVLRQGYEAGTNGVGLNCNPYAAGTKAYRDWRDGFHLAYGYQPVKGSALDVGPL